MSDAWEDEMVKGEINVGGLDPNEDRDGDGWTNLEEFLNQTDARIPNDPMSWKNTHINGELN